MKSAVTGRESVITAWDGYPLPEHKSVVRVLATEDVPWGTGTATRRRYTLLVTDKRYWLSDAQIAEEAGNASPSPEVGVELEERTARCVVAEDRSRPRPFGAEFDNDPAIPLEVYVHHALVGAARKARELGADPALPAEAAEAYRWAEGEFERIARKEVGQGDLIG